MYKITILGSENSHANGFSNRINNNPNLDFQVIGLYGETEESAANNEKIKQTFPDIKVYDNIEDAVRESDAAMVTARHGKDHLPFARKFIEAGKPCFIDKPFTADPKIAVELVELAKKHQVPLSGGSCCGFVQDVWDLADIWNHASEKNAGYVEAPVNMVNNYGNFYFYSQHLIQIMCEIFGYRPRAVSLVRTDDHASGYVCYDDFKVDIFYHPKSPYRASITCDGEKIDRDINIYPGFDHEVETFCKMVTTGVMERTYEQQAIPVFIIAAMQASMDANGALTEIDYLL